MFKKPIIQLSIIAIIIGSVFIVNGLILAWTSPVSTPPADNVGAPINIGTDSQYKSGALGVGGVFHGYSSAIFDGNVIADIPTADNHLATKAYVDAQSGGGVTCDKVLTGDSGVAYDGYSAHEYCQAQAYQYAIPNVSAGQCSYKGIDRLGNVITGEHSCSQELGDSHPLGSGSNPLWCCK